MIDVRATAERVMSCTASVVLAPDDAHRADRAITRLRELEDRWSRFRLDSEVSGLNRASGSPRRCSTDTVTLVEALVQAWHATDGAFDPTLLGALVELGYATSRTDRELRTSVAPGTGHRGDPAGILVDRSAGVVTLPTGTVLDPGGIGKGLAADLVTAELMADGARGALVEIGGDLRVVGEPPGADAWVIELTSPVGGAPEHIRLADGGVATSTSRLRSWRVGDEVRHHLLDPATLAPTDGDVVGCTVVAGTAAWAEAFTKVPFVRGVDEALDRFEQRALAARVVTADGRTHRTSRWKEFTA